MGTYPESCLLPGVTCIQLWVWVVFLTPMPQFGQQWMNIPAPVLLRGPLKPLLQFSFSLILHLSLSLGVVSQSILQNKTVYKYSSHCLFARESVLKHDMDKQSLFYFSLYWTYYILCIRLGILYMKYTTKSHSLITLNIS